MQTFLPYRSFSASAKALDSRRLGKQRVEALQIYRALLGITVGWRNHPATRMWEGCEGALIWYHNDMIREWVSRGFNNTMELLPETRKVKLPWWLGDEAFHASHRSNLLRKDPIWYGQFGWSEPPNLPYVWPEPLPCTSKVN